MGLLLLGTAAAEDRRRCDDRGRQAYRSDCRPGMEMLPAAGARRPDRKMSVLPWLPIWHRSHR